MAVKKNGHESVPENNGVLGTLPIPHTVSYGLRGVPGVLCIAVRTLHGDLQVSRIEKVGKKGQSSGLYHDAEMSEEGTYSFQNCYCAENSIKRRL